MPGRDIATGHRHVRRTIAGGSGSATTLTMRGITAATILTFIPAIRDTKIGRI